MDCDFRFDECIFRRVRALQEDFLSSCFFSRTDIRYQLVIKSDAPELYHLLEIVDVMISKGTTFDSTRQFFPIIKFTKHQNTSPEK